MIHPLLPARCTVMILLPVLVLSLIFFFLMLEISKEELPPFAKAETTPLAVQRFKSQDILGQNTLDYKTQDFSFGKVIATELKASSPTLNNGESKNIKEPPFYKADPMAIANLSSDQRAAYNAILQDYLEFFKEWTQRYPMDTNMWDKKIKEYEDQLVLMLGSSTYNALIYR
jgi:hypothetical protein